MGIDPGSVITGYGLIETDGVRSFHLAHGHIRVKGDTFADRLGHIFESIGALIVEWRPAEVAIEQVFMSNNPMSALKLGQARGAAITAAVSRSLPVAEYAPRAVKQVVTGSGGAGKARVQTMVRAMLEMAADLQVDAADGLAIAICHAHSRIPHSAAGAGMPDARGRRPGAAATIASLPTRRRTAGRGLRR